MYKVGEFSKIVNIPVRTLRYYAECGVLVPKKIDPFTGYKYYSDDNVLECELIKLLKSFDFTLDKIVEYKDCIDYEILEKKKKEIEEQIYMLRLKYEKITLMQKELEESKKGKILRRNYEKRDIK
ncbi:MAG: MerR family transcriptional regulator [Mycoplasmatota bacterium]